MNLEVVKLEDSSVIRWAGGITSQLYIYPKNASYKELNFDFRLSVAIAEQEYSDYTVLPGVTRHLIMLDGTARVFHQNIGYINMIPYKTIDVFDGGLKSHSKGQVTDFNLMVMGRYKGKINVIEQSTSINLHEGFMAFYCHNDSFVVSVENKKYKVGAGELAVLSIGRSQENNKINIILDQSNKIIQSNIWIE